MQYMFILPGAAWERGATMFMTSTVNILATLDSQMIYCLTKVSITWRNSRSKRKTEYETTKIILKDQFAGKQMMNKTTE